MSFVVGEKVRVLESNHSATFSSRGIVSYVNDDGTFDILFPAENPSLSTGGQEENNVPLSRIKALQEFELDVPIVVDQENGATAADQYKAYGNILFGLKDFDAAIEWYVAAILLLRGNKSGAASATPSYSPAAVTSTSSSIQSVKRLHSANSKLSVGQAVLVEYPETLNYRTGVISDLTLNPTGSCPATAPANRAPSFIVDVILDGPRTAKLNAKPVVSDDHDHDNDDDDDEELGLSSDRITLLANNSSDQQLQRALYLNLARCELKLLLKGWAIKHASIALAISEHLFVTQMEELQLNNNTNTTTNKNSSVASARTLTQNLRKNLSDCLYFRGKALLSASRPKFASMDCNLLSNFDAQKAATLKQEIDIFKVRRAKSNRKLAKDVASWVDTAMEISKQQQQQESSADSVIPDEDDSDADVVGVGESSNNSTTRRAETCP